MRATAKLRQLLQEPGIIMAPGAYDCLTARIIEQAGFPAVYMTGAGTSVAQLGFPDLGLATMTEMIANAYSRLGSRAGNCRRRYRIWRRAQCAPDRPQV